MCDLPANPVVGDAISSFNPTYGPGMTAAAREATALRELLREGADRFPPRFFKAAAAHDPVLAWRFLDATGFDVPVASMFGPDSLRRIARTGRSTSYGGGRQGPGLGNSADFVMPRAAR